MFTDIVGYTALMGSDEQKAFDLLDQSRKIQQPIIERHGGKWIKEMGDGVLAAFSTATNAVHSAILIQEQLSVSDLKLRIAIHLGDVIFDNNDVFGDGVNIAARLLAHSEPGGILVSGTVHESIANKKGIISNFHKEESLKNVKQPVRMYRVSGEEGGPGYSFDQVSEHPVTVFETMNKVPEKSVAVLPFVNMSNDSEQEYFSDGITEEILNSLAHVKDLRVAGRTSSFYFKGKNIDLRKIGRELNVETVLEGSVRRSGNKLRITAQLISVSDGYHLWSERYDRPFDDIFAIQDEIAMAITDQLKVTLLDQEKTIIQTRPTSHTEAYDLYLKGRFYLNRRGPGIQKALDYFAQAVKLDPEFVYPYTGIADAYSILALYGHLPPHFAMTRARENAETALKLDPNSVEALTTLAFICTFYDWDWEEANQQFRRVFAIRPNYAPAHYWYSHYLCNVCRRFDEGIAEAKRAATLLDPLLSIAHHFVCVSCFSGGRYEEGLKEAQLSVDLDENSFPAYRGLALVLASLGRFEEAVAASAKAIEVSRGHPLAFAELSWIYWRWGKIEPVREILEKLESRRDKEFIAGVILSGPAYFSGQYEKAAEYLRLAIEQRDCSLGYVNGWPLCKWMHEDPRYKFVLEKLNFPS
jgi:TolB-like protein